MRIKILSFGIAREIINSASIELKDQSSVKDLIDQLKSKYPKLRALRSIAVAVNEDYKEEHYILSESDEIAIIPPVSGG
jgi:molybdopterin converting factor subunit 1